MKKQLHRGVVGLGVLLLLSAGISPALGETGSFGGNERPVTEALETASPEIAFGEAERPVSSALDTGSPTLQEWATAWEYFNAVETGAIPKTASEEPWMKEYGND